ncbi:MAG: transposase [Pseudomonadota bacterium]
MMKSTRFEGDDQDPAGRIDEFMKRFKLGTLLSRAGIRKVSGGSPLLILRTIFELAFVGRNVYTGVHNSPTASTKMDVVYRFLSVPRHNRRRFLGFLSDAVIKCCFKPVTDEKREDVLILDDTPYDRSRSKKVELLARVHDHSKKRYLKGFRMLVLGWSDGASYVPVDHAVLSSTKKKNRIQGITKEMDRRTCGAGRRQEAMTKSTDLIVPMVKRALGLFIPAKYLLMDSWLGFPAVVRLFRILSLVRDKVRVLYETSEQLVQQIIETTMKEALALIRPGFAAECESCILI